jgi:hypothetical protein
VVSADRIDAEPAWYTGKHPLICWKCDAGVHAKGTYVKRNGASYRAHFALNPKTGHEAGCPFNPVEVITSIARDAQDLAHVEDGVLKLTLPGAMEDLAPPPQADPTSAPGAVTARRIDTVRPALPPLLNCAAKIARFLQLNAFDDNLVRRFRVQPHGHKNTIPWGRFCYGPSAAAYGELVGRLDPARGGRAPSHPVAVYGTVQRVHHDRAGRPFVFLADHTDLDGAEFEVVVRSLHPGLIEPLTVGTHVLAVGAWGTFNQGRVPQLRLFADEAWQIAYWHTDPGTGSATQPVSPPAVTARQRADERPARRPSKPAPRPAGASGRRAAAPARRVTPPLPASLPPAGAAPQAVPQRPAPPVPPPGGPRTPPANTGAPQADSPPDPPPSPTAPPLPAVPVPAVRPRRGRLRGWLGLRRERRS